MFRLLRYHTITDGRIRGPRWDQPPMHKPALVAALVPDNDGMLGEVSGATLKRGVYFGRSRSKFQRSRMSLNSNVAVNRPHISGSYSAAVADGQDGCLSSPGTV